MQGKAFSTNFLLSNDNEDNKVFDSVFIIV